MENELVSVKDLLIGRVIVDIQEITDRNGSSVLKFQLDDNSVLKMGMRDGSRHNATYLCSFLSLNDQEIYNDVDGQISSL